MEAADAKSSEELIPYCPCNDYLEEELSIECELCQILAPLLCWTVCANRGYGKLT